MKAAIKRITELDMACGGIPICLGAEGIRFDASSYGGPGSGSCYDIRGAEPSGDPTVLRAGEPVMLAIWDDAAGFDLVEFSCAIVDRVEYGPGWWRFVLSTTAITPR
jgi:hypothetical protein